MSKPKSIQYFRYLMISNKVNSKSITYKTCFLVIAVCIVLSLIWTTFPLVGWSYYSPEGLKMSCSVEWQDRSLNVMSYSITIIIFVFIEISLKIFHFNYIKLIFLMFLKDSIFYIIPTICIFLESFYMIF